MKKRNLSQYEKIMLAAAYNIKEYCGSTNCDECIFDHNHECCILDTGSLYPACWELYKIDRGDDK